MYLRGHIQWEEDVELLLPVQAVVLGIGNEAAHIIMLLICWRWLWYVVSADTEITMKFMQSRKDYVSIHYIIDIFRTVL
jgi:hypothetical protein